MSGLSIQASMGNDEERRVAAARCGDRDAFRLLVEAYARMLFTLCVRITRDATLAEDAVQEALFNAWRHIAEFDGHSSFKTWLHRIAVNAALEQMRRDARHDRVDAGAQGSDVDDDFLFRRSADEPGPEQQALGNEIGRHVDAHLGRMTVIERTAFVLRHAEGHSIEEISQTLSMNTSASKQAIFRAVRKLRGALQPLR
ncbi:MAG TPA: RNA polymerase sigma factor [Rudaea sp.]|jgi:RNA polymerase sigma-70 factor (ECF subfamily)